MVWFREILLSLRRCLRRALLGFKCFLVPSGVDEFPHVTEEHLREAMPELTRLDALLIVHAELPGPIRTAGVHPDNYRNVSQIRVHALLRMKRLS